MLAVQTHHVKVYEHCRYYAELAPIIARLSVIFNRPAEMAPHIDDTPKTF